MTLQGKRILLTTESLGPVNGVSRTTRSLIEYFQRQGAALVVVAPGLGSSDLGPAAKTARLGPAPEIARLGPTKSSLGPGLRPGCKEIRIPGKPLPYNPDLTVVYPIHLHDLYRQAFNAPPDLIYIASPASLGFQILLQARQLQHPPPILVNFQTDLSAYAQILLPDPLCRFATGLVDAVQGYLFRHAAVQTVFYPSSAMQTYLVDTGTPAARLQRLGRGVDTALFSPAHHDATYRASIAPHGELILLCVCRLAPEKGFEFLATVVERLVQATNTNTTTTTTRRVKMLIVGGNGNPVVDRRIRALFAGMPETVVFTGFLTGRDLARAYAIADVFLHCSVTETFGLVVLEAMASAVPVVAREQGGPVDIVQPGRTGFLVSPGDVDGFVDAVLRVVEDDGLRGALGRNALAYAQATTWDAINARVASRMAEVLGQGQGQGQGEDQGEGEGEGTQRLGLAWVAWVVEVVRLRLAVAVVYAMWVIAVVPLLVHGRFFVSL